MSGRHKILQILKEIKCESEINPNPEWVKFKFNISVVGAGVLTDDQEKRILMKLEKDGIIEIHLPDGNNDQEEAMLSMFTPVEFMMHSDFIWIRILPSFYKKYFWYSSVSLLDDKWNYVNPFWILWRLTQGALFLIECLWNKNRVLTIIFGVLSSFLVYDWSLAWKNLKIIFGYLNVL